MTQTVCLTKYSKNCGCAAKIGPGTLNNLLEKLPEFHDEHLMVGFDKSDDAAVYVARDDLAVIQTLDFFTPVVDDPYLFGRVAATNALSDVYAMGARPATALNIVVFPKDLPAEILGEILRGGADTVLEAGAVMAGGHSIQDDTPMYGLSVTGFAHPKEILTNAGALEGDVLLLTKQLGVGVVNTAVKGNMASEEARKEVLRVMCSLNKNSAECMKAFEVHACTDVTGFSLMGHAREMALASGVSLRIQAHEVPLIEGAPEYARMGLIPGGAYRNREFCGEDVVLSQGIPEEMNDLLFDPQTSGGLLFAVAAKDADAALSALQAANPDTKASIIGRVEALRDAHIYVDD